MMLEVGGLQVLSVLCGWTGFSLPGTKTQDLVAAYGHDGCKLVSLLNFGIRQVEALRRGLVLQGFCIPGVREGQLLGYGWGIGGPLHFWG